MADCMFPILNDPVLRAIPWDLIAPHERQAQKNHSQSLRVLASRGGLSPCEACAVIEDRQWRKMIQGYARALLLEKAWKQEKAGLSDGKEGDQ